MTRATWLLTALLPSILNTLPAAGDEPSEPSDLRTMLRERFDADRSGRLDEAERDTLRKERSKRGVPFDGNSRSGAGPRQGDRRQWTVPPQWLERYDTNKDGTLDQTEMRAAFAQMRKRHDEVVKQYDANGDGELGDAEHDKLRKDIETGVITDVPDSVLRRRRRGRGPTVATPGIRWQDFDDDRDGRFDATELAAARATLRGERPSGETPQAEAVEIPKPPAEPAEPAEPLADDAEQTRGVKFSHRRGLIEKEFGLELRSRTPQARIRYTLDGSEPTESAGTLYTGPIRVTRTSVVRARAFADGLLPSRTSTRTFLRLADVIRQSPDGLPPAGFHLRWGANAVDYGMDPRVVDDPTYASQIVDALKSIPSISLVADPEDLFGEEKGIYANARRDGREWERRASIELLFPDARSGFQEDCGVRVRGGFSRSSGNPKHAFRLFFRKEYGEGKLKYPLFGSQGAAEFDNIDLRCSQNYSWSMGRDPRGLFVRDQFSRDTQLAMGHPAARGEYYHLYINGHYWGLFNSCERPEASYGATYFGGNKDEYDVIKVNTGRNAFSSQSYGVSTTDGNLRAWRRLWDAADAGLEDNAAYFRLQGRDLDGRDNPDHEALLDVVNLIDYMLVVFYSGNMDAPISKFTGNRRINNWYGIRHRDGSDGFCFFLWDSEHTLLDVGEDRTGPFPAGDRFGFSNPQWLWQRCLDNAEFRMKVADRIHRHFSNSGALTRETATARFLHRTRQIEAAVIAESARWGDSRGRSRSRGGDSLPRTRDVEWRAEVDRIVEDYFPKRGAIVLDQLWQHGLIPEIVPPELSRHGGELARDAELTIEAPAGEIWYTIDGRDPRRIGGALNTSATRYEGPIRLDAGARVRCRVRQDDEWSALTTARFTISAAK